MAELSTISARQLDERGGPSALRGGPPVIIRGLFATSPIASLSIDDIMALLHGERATMVAPYETFMEPFTGEPRTYDTTFDKFLAIARKGVALPLYISEMPTPAALQRQFDIPAALHGPFEAARSYTFVGGPGNVAPFHFDGDFRSIILYQLFGTKRLYLLPASASRWMHPVFNFCGLRFERYTQRDREHFVDEIGGWHGEIGPGDAFYMGPGVWHCLDYVDFTMSVNFRFGRTLDQYLLSRLPPNFRTAVIVSELHGTPGERALRRWILDTLRTFYQPHASGLARYEAMRQRYSEHLARLGLQRFEHLAYDSIDSERMAVSGDIDITAARIPGLNHEVRLAGRVLRQQRPISRRDARRLDRDERRQAMGTTWAQWRRLLRVPEDIGDLTNYQAAMIADFLDYGMSNRRPRQARVA